MSLTITPELIRELSGYRTRSDMTAIILGPDGWDCHVTESRPGPDLTALTLENVDGFCDGEDLSDDLALALATELDYTIRYEDGTARSGEDADWMVVTGAVVSVSGGLPSGADLPWQDCCWFEPARAVRVLEEDGKALREHTGKTFSLWLTEGGQWLVTSQADETGQWYLCTPEQAADLIYAAPEYLVAEEADGPLLVRAARKARELADLAGFAAPVPAAHDTDRKELTARARSMRKDAIEHEQTVGVIGDLIRESLQADVRTGRQAAARTVHIAHEENDSRAASDLRISRRSLARLLND